MMGQLFRQWWPGLLDPRSCKTVHYILVGYKSNQLMIFSFYASILFISFYASILFISFYARIFDIPKCY